MTDTPPAAPAPQQPQQLVPTLGELLQLIPDAGQIYVQFAMEKWTSNTLREVHAAQLAQRDKQVVALQSALLAAGIDPNTLQAKGDPEVGATPEPTTPEPTPPEPSDKPEAPPKAR